MRILGLSLGDTSAAAVMVDGRVVACVSEERFSRVKRDESYPRQAIEYCLEAARLRPAQLDTVAVGGVHWDVWRVLTHYFSRFSIEDLRREQESRQRGWPDLFRGKWDLEQYPGGWKELVSQLRRQPPLDGQGRERELVDRFLDSAIVKHLGIDAAKIVRVDHHTAFGAYAYWSSPLRGKETGVIILGAGGDGIGASVAAPSEFGLMPLGSIPSAAFHFGRMLREITLLLGLPPRDHDPFIMGLASRAPEFEWKQAYRVFEQALKVEGWNVRSVPMPSTYLYFQDKLSPFSAAAIAGGAQRFVEDKVSEWVGNVVRGSRLRRFAVAGSLSLNHRVISRIACLPSVREVFVPPAAGEGALAMGACMHLSTIRFGVQPQPLSDCYLGPDISASDVAAELRALRASGRYAIRENASPDHIAGLLAKSEVVARCAGRAEFGLRGLGNRSILADPRAAGEAAVMAVKPRDAHVPFSPAILADRSSRYLRDGKSAASAFMTLAFAVKERALRDLGGAVDATERTARPQLLQNGSNPRFAAIIRAFERKTGVGALLNTSFNGHGEPMVLTARDAVRVFKALNIRHLILDRWLISLKR